MRFQSHKIHIVLSVLLVPIFLEGCKKSLHKAIKSSNIGKIEQLINRGANVNARNERGQTPLHIAAIVGREDVANLLLLNGADIDACDHLGWTPLHAAAANSQWAAKVAELLISKGANIYARTTEGITTLHEAARGGNKRILDLLIEKGVDVNATDKHGKTPLHWAVEFGQYNQEETVELLIAAGAKVWVENKAGFSPIEESLFTDNQTIANLLVSTIELNTPDDSGDTPLHRAVRKNNVKLVKILIEYGANVNAKDKQGDTPLDVAVNYVRNKEIVDLLITEGAKKGVQQELKLPSSVSQDELMKDLKKLVSNGGNIDTPDGFGRTSLHKASRHGFTDVVSFLITNDANPNAIDKLGFTPLQYAVMHSQLEIAKILIDHGANVNVKTKKEGYTALHFAVLRKEKNQKLVQLLIENGADVNIASASDQAGGQTPLHMSVAVGNIPLTKLFLAKGADINARDKTGATPLHEAARRGHKEIVELLIEKDAEINAKDDNGMTPLVHALSDDPKIQAVAEILRKHGGRTYGWQAVKE
jgi:ankyrin repeat protein